MWSNTVSTELELANIDNSLTIASVTVSNDNPDNTKMAKAMAIAREKVLSMHFIMAASR